MANSSGLFNIAAQLIGLSLDEAIDHALFDNGVATRPEPGPQKQIGNVAPPAAGPFRVVEALSITGDFAPDRDFRKCGVLALKRTVGIIKHQLDGRLPTG